MRNDKINEKVCNIMEYRSNTEEIFQRRKQRWLKYGRAFFTIGILGLITIALYSITHGSTNGSSSNSSISNEESSARFMVIEEKTKSISAIVKNEHQGLSEKILAKREAKESFSDEKIPKSSNENLNSNSELELDGQHLKIFRRQQLSDNNIPHRHTDNGVYIFKGYKCVPIRKPTKQLEYLRARHRKGMCV